MPIFSEIEEGRAEKKYSSLEIVVMENPLKIYEFLKNKYFFNEKSPSYILIPENGDFLKEKCLSFA
jgi:hypothetical protein